RQGRHRRGRRLVGRSDSLGSAGRPASLLDLLAARDGKACWGGRPPTCPPAPGSPSEADERSRSHALATSRSASKGKGRNSSTAGGVERVWRAPARRYVADDARGAG